MAAVSASPRLKRIQRSSVALLVLGCAVNYMDRSTLAVANPLICHDLGLSIADMGLLLSAFLWAYDRGRNARHRTPPAQNPAGGIPAPGSHLGCLTAKRWLGQGCVMRGLGSHRFCSTVIRFHVTFPF